jgi:hypothetical protein
MSGDEQNRMGKWITNQILNTFEKKQENPLGATPTSPSMIEIRAYPFPEFPG